MAKKHGPKKCVTRNCLVHKFWPALAPSLGANASYYIDSSSGELFIASGFRVSLDLELVAIEPTDWARVRCSCGTEGVVRGDLLRRGLTTCCPACSAAKHTAERN